MSKPGNKRRVRKARPKMHKTKQMCAEQALMGLKKALLGEKWENRSKPQENLANSNILLAQAAWQLNKSTSRTCAGSY